MKKVIFSAVALMAFSVLTVAGNKEIKDTKKETSKKEVKPETNKSVIVEKKALVGGIQMVACIAYAYVLEATLVETGSTPERAHEIFKTRYNDCLVNNF